MKSTPSPVITGTNSAAVTNSSTAVSPSETTMVQAQLAQSSSSGPSTPDPQLSRYLSPLVLAAEDDWRGFVSDIASRI